jgi:hypothetical protein
MPRDTEMQMVELLHGAAPTFDVAAIHARACEILGEVTLVGGSSSSESILFAHPAHVMHVSDGRIPAQTALLKSDKPFDSDAYVEERQQSWSCPAVEELLGGCGSVSMLTEMMCRTLEPQDRAMLFHGVLQAVVEVSKPMALVFLHSQQVVSAADYLDDCGEEPICRRGSINVRFFTVSDTDGDMIMDTRGLYELGLHDLQCHFRNLEPDEVSRKLRNVGAYLVENGPVIKSGETVNGIDEDEKWSCRFEQSLLEPKREILDLDPGKKHAAGNR